MANLFSTFVTMIITGTVAIVAVMVARFFLKPAPRIFSYLLWIAVLVRLTCPVLPQSDHFGVVLHLESFGEKMDAFSEESTNLPTEKIVVTSEAKDGTDNLSVQERKETVEHSFVPAQPEMVAKGSAGTDAREAFIKATNVFHVCPIIENYPNGPLHIEIEGKEGTKGTVICEQVKLIDPSVRGCSRADRVSYETIMNISDAIQGIFEYD